MAEFKFTNVKILLWAMYKCLDKWSISVEVNSNLVEPYQPSSSNFSVPNERKQFNLLVYHFKLKINLQTLQLINYLLPSISFGRDK